MIGIANNFNRYARNINTFNCSFNKSYALKHAF